MEREPVAAQPATYYNIGAALAGAVIGGVLGHQIGGGTGKQLATVGGAVAGAAAGANVDRIMGRGQQAPARMCRSATPCPAGLKLNFGT